MKTLLRISLLTVALVAALVAPAFAGQPHMRHAIDFLEEAKTSNRPIDALASAKVELENAAHDKGGERPKAIDWIDDAIKAAREGRRERMLERINHAISDVRTGIVVDRR